MPRKPAAEAPSGPLKAGKSPTSEDGSFEPYWRDPAFYKRRFGVESATKEGQPAAGGA